MEIGMTKIKKGLLNNSLFRQCYIIVLLACDVSYVHFVAFFGLGLMVIWGSFLFIYNQVTRHTALKTRYGFWLIALLLSSFVTMMIHVLSNALLNFVFVMHLGMMFFIFYSVHTEKQLNFKHELFNVSRMIVYITTVLNAVGLLLLVLGVDFEFWKVKFIIYENRFTGVFFNPNLLGFVSTVGIVCCHIIHKDGLVDEIGKPKFNRVLMAASGTTNVFALILCDSNAAFVLALGYVLLYVIYMFFDVKRRMSVSKWIAKILTVILVCALIAGSSMVFRTVFKAGFAVVNAKTNALVDVIFHDEEIINEIEEEEEDNSEATFEHENKNLDSGRFKMWKESVGLFKISPIIGISNGNIVFYSGEYLNGALKYNYNNNDLHNGFLTILVSTGLIGGLLFGTFGFRIAKHSFQHLYWQEKSWRSEAYPCLFAFLGAYVFYSFFEKALLYDISFLVMWFWLFMGYLSCFIVKHESNLQNRYLFGKKRFTRAML